MKKNKTNGERCVLYDRECIGCGECEFCDLDPLKICDNCGKCLNIDDFASIKIDSVDGNEIGGHSKKASADFSVFSDGHAHEHSHGHSSCDCDDDCCDCDCDEEDECDCGCHGHDHTHGHGVLH